MEFSKEQMIQVQMLEQEAQQLNKELQVIDQHISEMQELEESLIDLEDEGSKEILANIGKRIYLPVSIKSKDLVVEVGKGHFVKKSVKDTVKIVREQIGKLVSSKGEILNRLEELQGEIEGLLSKVEEKK